MRFKYNPWVSMVALLLLATILVLICTGCTADKEKADASGRFTIELARKLNTSNQLYIITDNETGVQYLLADLYNGGGLTKLED